MAALWWAVVVSGVYHGVNPGMGWPLAVSAALMERRAAAMAKALAAWRRAFLAMRAILLPFSLMRRWWLGNARCGSARGAGHRDGGVPVDPRRHPRFLARVPPGGSRCGRSSRRWPMGRG